MLERLVQCIAASPKISSSLSPKETKLTDFMRPGDEGFDERTASVAQSLQRDVAMPLMPSRASLVSIDLPDDGATGVRSSLARSPSSTSGEVSHQLSDRYYFTCGYTSVYMCGVNFICTVKKHSCGRNCLIFCIS